MQRKLKSVFRRSSKSTTSLDQPKPLESNVRHVQTSLPNGDRHCVSADGQGRTSVGSSATRSIYTGRSRPVSSIYDDPPSAAREFAMSSDPNGGAIANDYKAYLPALSPVNDDQGDDYMVPNGHRRHLTEDSITRHEEDVADRNIARYSKSIDGGSRTVGGTVYERAVRMASGDFGSNPKSNQENARRQSVGAVADRNPPDFIPTGGTVAKSSVGNNGTASDAHPDSKRTHTETVLRRKSLGKGSNCPTKKSQVEYGRDRTEARTSVHGDNILTLPRGTHAVQELQSGLHHATRDESVDGEESALARKLREDGVVDLRNTVDTDGEVTWAPAVTHEVVKPHQHEIVQHKIYREIHNYEHFHRIQPVMMTEVLPPRHWIPNPDGEGLIEVSADELPARTGENRWWSICEHPSPYSRQTMTHKYRTEPEVIEAGTFMTEEGFERKETIIIHPPTLADLTGYGGPVQAMHFDHKTGKSWMGELTTMDKLRELQQELDRAPDARAFKMGELAETLPKMSSDSARTDSRSLLTRKPISGNASATHSSSVGRTMNAM